ncbi:amino acid adenylation domain-containing protein [Mucilaginibacter sp. 21P]|uniref:amino acid adenylation domain-containing protein n=1 Tax=Mucilaginibacter sp. 21P TaxID=2778902 RepID=UPI001C586486|nr:amino acid adenylation domain-containing protein [Mucilaginibacter sp. 21P]QXV63864.1 amino acid adenylation domain-containing protein [Mucilaginibacter sp. 21P]
MNKKVLHTLIDEHSHHQGERIAIKETLGGLSYIKLRAYSNAIGHGLVGLGLLPGEAAGVYLPGGMGYVSAILGVNKAGGIFMPLERKYPDNRLRWLLEYVSPGLIITDAEGAEKLKAITQEGSYRLGRLLVISLSPSELRMREYEASTGYSAELTLCTADVAIDLTGEEGNYLLYTSGSTGYPKVIEGCHKSLSHFIHWEVKEFGLNSESLVSQLVPLSFDVSLRDIFAPLLSGGTLCIPDEGLKGDPVGLLKWIRSEGITLIHTVPSLLRLLTRELELNPGLKAGLSTLQHLLLSGEALYGKDVLHWRKAAGGGVELVNLYGPTETTLAKVYNRIGDDAGDPGAVIPLGNPLPNTAVLICNDNTQSKIGAIGEIYIKTPFRSRGYYKDASLTAGSFIQNPLHNDYEDIVYRTGDLGKYLADRSIAFVGRQDSQVKIRGNRVELSETERVLHGYPGISQAVVIAIKGADESDVLACYYVATGAIDDDELRNYLKAHLPDYMHPSYFCQLDEFPLNLNGKVNRKALPRPEDLLYEKR